MTAYKIRPPQPGEWRRSDSSIGIGAVHTLERPGGFELDVWVRDSGWWGWQVSAESGECPTVEEAKEAAFVAYCSALVAGHLEVAPELTEDLGLRPEISRTVKRKARRVSLQEGRAIALRSAVSSQDRLTEERHDAMSEAE